MSTAADTAAVPGTLPAVEKTPSLRDFSDRLSPMLVKELRQGLKSPLFVWGLVAMQVALTVMAFVALEDGNTRDVNEAFWWSVTAILCLVLPARAANALHEESGGNTLDTLVLTHLSAWRITLGKWVAIAALQALVTVTVLPFLVVRHFAGGVSIPMELAWLAVYFLFGLVVSAVLLGLSWFRYFSVRAVVLLAAVGGAAGFCGGTIDEISRSNNYGLDELIEEGGWWGAGLIVAGVLWFIFFFLDLGASRIAPVAENRATRRRLAAMALFVVSALTVTLATFPDRDIPPVCTTILTGIMVIASVQALCERPANFSPVLRPFLRRGAAGKWAGRLFYPGWASGFFFSMLLLTGCFVLLAWAFYRLMTSRHFGGSYEAVFQIRLLSALAGAAGTIILPLVVARLFLKMEHWNFWRWLLITLCAACFALFAGFSGARVHSSMLNLFHLLPGSGGMATYIASAQVSEERRMLLDQEKGYYPSQEAWDALNLRREELTVIHARFAFISLGLWLAVAAWLAGREMGVTRRAERALLEGG